MRGNNKETVIQRFLVMGCCSALLHVVIAAIIILPGMSVEKPAKVYSVEVKYLQAKTEKMEEAEPVAVVPERAETRKQPAAVDLTRISAPLSLETVIPMEEALENMDELVDVDIVETPVPTMDDAIITPGGGLGSGADAEAGGGNSLLTAGTERGWGGEASGVGWGAGSGSPGSGGGTGGGYGSGTGNSRGRAGAVGEETGVYFAGMQGIIPPVYERTPQPNYPEASRSRGEQGEVLLKVEVLANGRVGQLEVDKSSGYARLDEAALRTVRNWRFKAAMKGREVVICWVNIPISFRLNK